MDQILETKFHQLSKHIQFRQKYSAAPGQFSILFSAFGYPDETLSLVFDIERFSFECRKVIGFAFATLHYWLKNSRQFFIQSEVKPKPIVTLLPRVFPRFASATCNYFEFWFVHCIVCVLCDCPESLLWFWFYDTKLKTTLTTVLTCLLEWFSNEIESNHFGFVLVWLWL